MLKLKDLIIWKKVRHLAEDKEGLVKLTDKFKRVGISKAYANTSLYNNSSEIVHLILVENGIATQKLKLKPRQMQILPSVSWSRVILARSRKNTADLIISR